MHNMMKVARWEFIKNIKSPVFLILTFIFPLIMLAASGIGFLTSISASTEDQSVVVIDETGSIFSMLEENLASTSVQLTLYNVAQKKELQKEVDEGIYNGYLHLTEDNLQRGTINYYVKDNREQNTMVISGALREAVTTYRLAKTGISRDDISEAIAPVSLQTLSLTGEEASLAGFLMPFAVAMVLMFSAIFSGQVLMYGVIKEKRNRIVEILLSSISALELLMGKLVGFAALGLIQIAIWLSVGLAAASLIIDLREVTLTAGDLIPSIVFFLGGYLLFASLFAALGATMKDAEGGSQSQGMVVIIPMIPLFAAGAILMSPNALWVRIMSFIPIFTPITMLMRIAATTIPWWEMTLAFIVLLVSVIFFVYLGSRIFSRGILQFERTISFREIRRMLKKNYS